ncbi:MAG TPA: hypothetical protein HPP76_01395 [Desulfuromonadales bacterium]|nr:hypothetical protein [Desulfuromonadales bacterium]
MKLLRNEHIPAFFAALDKQYRLLVPVLLCDGTRSLGAVADGPLALTGGALPAKPTSAFFPQHETILGGDCSADDQEKPLVVAGFTARDLGCLAFIDRFFSDAPVDDIYLRNRRQAVVIGVSGYCGADGTLLPTADGGCDAELVFDGADWLALDYSEVGKRLIASLPDAGELQERTLENVREKGGELSSADDKLIRHAAAIVQSGAVPDEFWRDIGDRCIACTGCNLVCPTCTCFGVQDWRYESGVERSRMWDSCQLEGFMREASGHNPLGSEAQRTRRRIHHKLAADPLRWGEVSCFVCGRCDATCPTGIGMQAVAKEIVTRYGR